MEWVLRVKDLLKGLFNRDREWNRASPEELERLQTAFKTRYHHFKLLLNANNKALELMAEMDQALRGTAPFAMTFVRSRCTQVSAKVFQIVQHIDGLAPGKYQGLYPQFKAIQQRINPHLRPTRHSQDGPLAVPLSAVGRELGDQVGGKMANLGEIANRLQLKVPPGFVITTRGYERFVEHNDLQTEIDRRLQAADVTRLDQLYELSAAIQQLITQSPLPEDLDQAIGEQYDALQVRADERLRVAMRSSALGEDFAGRNFAGQYRSELNVSGDSLVQAYKEIVASKYGLSAMTYRLNRGIPDEEVAMCVGCIGMVDAVAGGVAYSRNPVDPGDDTVVINAAWGLPKSVVDGSAACDVFVVAGREPMTIVRREIACKEHRFACYPEEGVCRLELSGEDCTRPSLEDGAVLEIAALVRLIEKHYGVAQDVEWALEADGSITLLQSRPLQRMDEARAADAEVPEQPAGSAARKESAGGGYKTEPAAASATEVSAVASTRGKAIPGGVQEVSAAEAAREESSAGGVLLQGGVTASPGAGAGPVFVVSRDLDALRFPEGGVLVTVQPAARWATLLGRAAAVVTEMGGIAGHLANVAREFGVPAMFGVEHAAAVLEPGRVVTVDADRLRVHDGRVEEVLKAAPAPRNLMAGSPVYEALAGAVRHISPLTLLDPEAPEFRPGNCTTLHDITRFCHELAVHEMFRFGADHRFPERSSKQLLCEVPMQFWIINLDDGFRDEVPGRYVRLEDIVSAPMTALWQGMMAVPWEGPPAVNAKGFMSVLLEATSNPALDPSMRSPYAMRNYFMIAREFCSLQSRFGFHFCGVEALVGERTVENYISFQFKGGAANMERRAVRTRFVAQILEEYGFRTEVQGDTAFARLEGYPRPFMIDRLRVLGYLIIHTRQLDMVMADAASVSRYRQRILGELRDIVLAAA